ncbi:MAG: sigma-70 family RNA polymerase sigma factor [Gemmatimonadetes bacterium]|nr:sigma-70 family RNA polymerase sigma factor [Gemmatimonadota bacterium]
MPETPKPEITRLLDQVCDGVPGAADALAEQVYGELHRIAVNAMRHEQDGHTLRPTELVSEAFMRLLGQRTVAWQNRSHFYGVAATTIRRILLDHARARRAVKRDHGVRITLDDSVRAETTDALDLIALDDALQRLERLAPRQGRVIELRFFGGLEIDEAAEVMGVSTATVKRDWTFARAFLLEALGPTA